MLRAGDFRILQCRRETSGVVTNCLVVRIGFKCGCARQHGAVKVVLRDIIVTYHSWVSPSQVDNLAVQVSV